MKILPLIILLSFCFNTFSQNRKEILKEIKGYTYGVIRFTPIETDEETYKEVIKNYFLQSGYKKDTTTDSAFTFFKTFPCVKSTPLKPHQVNEKNNRRNFIHASEKKYTKSSQTGSVSIVIIKKDEGLDFNSSKTTNYIPGGPTTSKCIAVNNFLEQDLRTFIYEHYNGKTITIPDKLMTKIENYNDRRKKESRKLVEGRDY